MSNIIKLVSNKDEQVKQEEVKSEVNNIPLMLRKLADEIEQDELNEGYKISGATLVLTDEDGDCGIFGYGEDTENVHQIYFILDKALQHLRDAF